MAHGGVLGIQPPGPGQLPGRGLHPRPGFLGNTQCIPGQRRLGLVLLAGPASSPAP